MGLRAVNEFAGLDVSFWQALARSLTVAAATGGLSLAAGWPLGTAAGVWACRGKSFWLGVLSLPLLLPSFLLAIGLSMLWRGFDGIGGTVLAFSSAGVPLVMMASLAAVLSVTRSQADAARLAGGEPHLFRLALRSARPLAMLAAALAAVLTIADAGPGQILGWPGAAGEMLVSFAARYDRAMATRQALAITAVAAVLTWPLVWRLAPHVADGLFSRDAAPLEKRSRPGLTVLWALTAMLFALLPLAGLLRPLLRHEWPLARAWQEVTRTAGDTLLYALLSAGLAVMAGFGLALAAGRSPLRRRLLAAGALALLALPPALPALWAIPWSSSFTLSAVLALRGLPVAVLFGLRAAGSMPPSWSQAARVFRVPRWRFAGRVVLPWLGRWMLPAALLAALLATAEVGTVLLLHPPGHGTLPLAIFTIMANAPEALVAMLCLLYVALAATLAAVGARLFLPRS